MRPPLRGDGSGVFEHRKARFAFSGDQLDIVEDPVALRRSDGTTDELRCPHPSNPHFTCIGPFTNFLGNGHTR